MTIAEQILGFAQPGDAGERAATALGRSRLLQVLSRGAGIRTHRDYFDWLQWDVGAFIPHDTVLAVWGDFTTGKLHYDVASVRPGVDTRAFRGRPGVTGLLQRIYEELNAGGERWGFVRGFPFESASCCRPQLSHEDCGCGEPVEHRPDMLVYAVNCERAGYDCFYAFALTAPASSIDPQLLHLLVPHVDAALRRVEVLPSEPGCASTAASVAAIASLSRREREVLEWVSQGKSNDEIGVILGISHNTVKNHLKRIFGKLGVSARSQAVHIYAKEASARGGAGRAA